MSLDITYEKGLSDQTKGSNLEHALNRYLKNTMLDNTIDNKFKKIRVQCFFSLNVDFWYIRFLFLFSKFTSRTTFNLY